MIYGVDAAYPGDPAKLAALNWQFVCGYLGGGNETRAWTSNEWRAFAQAGFKLGPIAVAPFGEPSNQVGVDHGNRALVAMQALHLSGMVLHDVENGATPRDYAKGFVDSCHAGSCAVTLYGSRTTILAIGDLYDSWWLAEWVQSGTKLGKAPLDWSMWQYATGPNYDYNVAVDDFKFAVLN